MSKTSATSLLSNCKQFLLTTWKHYKSLRPSTKAFVWFVIAVNVFIVSFIVVVGPAKIFQTLYNMAQALRENPYGWVILGFLLIILSFPPLWGYTTVVTLCGFTYGLKGFLLAGPGAVIGSAIVFVTLRACFASRLREMRAHNDVWAAFENVIRVKGLPLIILLRLSPLPPWVYANACFASIEPVKLWQFVLATICVWPKIFLSVFIGSKVAILSDGQHRSEMDTPTKILNIFFIVIGASMGAAAAWILYRATQKEIRELRASNSRDEELAAEALEALEENAPLLQDRTSSM